MPEDAADSFPSTEKVVSSKLSPKTLLEMLAGRKAMHRAMSVDPKHTEVWQIADSGENMLRSMFGTHEFIAMPSFKNHTIELSIYEKNSTRLLLQIEEPARNFVSKELLTKVMLICG